MVEICVNKLLSVPQRIREGSNLSLRFQPAFGIIS